MVRARAGASPQEAHPPAGEIGLEGGQWPSSGGRPLHQPLCRRDRAKRCREIPLHVLQDLGEFDVCDGRERPLASRQLLPLSSALKS